MSEWIDRELEHLHREAVDRRHRERRAEQMRLDAVWYMTVESALLCGRLGLEYPVNGDRRPTIRA